MSNSDYSSQSLNRLQVANEHVMKATFPVDKAVNLYMEEDNKHHVMGADALQEWDFTGTNPSGFTFGNTLKFQFTAPNDRTMLKYTFIEFTLPASSDTLRGAYLVPSIIKQIKMITQNHEVHNNYGITLAYNKFAHHWEKQKKTDLMNLMGHLGTTVSGSAHTFYFDISAFVGMIPAYLVGKNKNSYAIELDIETQTPFSGSPAVTTGTMKLYSVIETVDMRVNLPKQLPLHWNAYEHYIDGLYEKTVSSATAENSIEFTDMMKTGDLQALRILFCTDQYGTLADPSDISDLKLVYGNKDEWFHNDTSDLNKFMSIEYDKYDTQVPYYTGSATGYTSHHLIKSQWNEKLNHWRNKNVSDSYGYPSVPTKKHYYLKFKAAVDTYYVYIMAYYRAKFTLATGGVMDVIYENDQPIQI